MILSTLLFVFNSFTQSKSEGSSAIDKKRIIINSSLIATTWTGSMTGLYHIWYKDQLKNSFSFENDSHLWLQMDKAGHAYTAWTIGVFTGDLFIKSGLSNKTSALIGGGIGLGYQTTFELFDGFSQGYGFSWSDMAANTFGSALYTGQQLLFEDQPLKLKFSYSPSSYAQYRPEVLGSSFLEKIFKDYNGQTYWISFSPGRFKQTEFIPRWLCLSFGYSADQKLKGDTDVFSISSSDGQTLNFQARREFILSLDIDLTKIPTKRKWVEQLLKQINYIKVPLPALRWNNGVTYGHWLYF